MLGVYDSMKKLIDKCDLYFEGHIVSKELLVKNYADFLASNFEKKHNVAISLHTGSGISSTLPQTAPSGSPSHGISACAFPVSMPSGIL